jgi:protein SCO1/2
VADSLAVQRAFNVERGGKMNHTPVTLIRISPAARWIRIDGFASADQLAGELRDVVASR